MDFLKPMPSGGPTGYAVYAMAYPVAELRYRLVKKKQADGLENRLADPLQDPVVHTTCVA